MMKSGRAIYNQGDIVLVPFPFSDLSSSKIRPVLIISNNSYNQNNLEFGILKVKSKIKVDAITALEKSIFLKTVGKIKAEVINQVKDYLLKLIDYK